MRLYMINTLVYVTGTEDSTTSHIITSRQTTVNSKRDTFPLYVSEIKISCWPFALPAINSFFSPSFMSSPVFFSSLGLSSTALFHFVAVLGGWPFDRAIHLMEEQQEQSRDNESDACHEETCAVVAHLVNEEAYKGGGSKSVSDSQLCDSFIWDILGRWEFNCWMECPQASSEYPSPYATLSLPPTPWDDTFGCTCTSSLALYWVNNCIS